MKPKAGKHRMKFTARDSRAWDRQWLVHYAGCAGCRADDRDGSLALDLISQALRSGARIPRSLRALADRFASTGS